MRRLKNIGKIKTKVSNEFTFSRIGMVFDNMQRSLKGMDLKQMNGQKLRASITMYKY